MMSGEMRSGPMNCKQAKAEIALWVGGDLDETCARQVRRHVMQCPCCREHWQRLQTGLQPLQAVQDVRPAPEETLWPRISATLNAESGWRVNRFNGWVPALTVAAAILAMFALVQNSTAPATRSQPGEYRQSATSPAPRSVQPVNMRFQQHRSGERWIRPYHPARPAEWDSMGTPENQRQRRERELDARWPEWQIFRFDYSP